jgi:hypothetical protein
MKQISFFLLLISGIIISTFFSSCRKERLLTDSNSKLSFSTDTLTFDTVFTTLGSTTKSFKVLNNNNGKLNITNIRLAGGNLSPFKLNIDGASGNEARNIEIDGKDSFYVFATVTIDPTNQNNPLFFIDSVLFETNGNLQKVYLIAWGQDAHFYVSELIEANENWVNDKPYVILNSMALASGVTLTIQPGVRVFMGGNSGIFVDGGAKIIAQGSCEDSIVFRGIRLEEFYREQAGQWTGIFLLRNSTGNIFEHVDITGALYGLSLGSCVDCGPADLVPFSTKASVTLKNSIIRNSLVNNIVAISSEVNAENCLIHTAGDNMVSLGLGGKYNFNHCTFANYGSRYVEHKKASLLISNVINDGVQNYAAELLDAQFLNTIIYGSIEEEIDTSIVNHDLNVYKYTFTNCLLRTKRNINDINYYTACIKNENPFFVNRSESNYRLDASSPAVSAGTATTVTTDLDCNARDGAPDMGCYEFTN